MSNTSERKKIINNPIFVRAMYTTPCLKNCAKLFLPELCQISTNCEFFWYKLYMYLICIYVIITIIIIIINVNLYSALSFKEPLMR